MSSEDRYGGMGGFAASLNSRVGAQARISKAIGFAWLCGGAAIATCLTASGVAVAFLGYSYSNRPLIKSRKPLWLPFSKQN
jgi:hypothetical protein